MMRMELILSDYNDAYILLKGTITGAGTAAVFLKNCAPFSNYTSEKPERKLPK